MAKITSGPPASGGGSQPISVVNAVIAFNTANILTGHTIYTPTAGDVIVPSASSITINTAFDGTTPTLSVISQGDVPSNGDFVGSRAVNSADGELTGGNHMLAGKAFTANPPFTSNATGVYYCQDATPIQVLLDDNNGGNPGSTHGSAVVVLSVVKAA